MSDLRKDLEALAERYEHGHVPAYTGANIAGILRALLEKYPETTEESLRTFDVHGRCPFCLTDGSREHSFHCPRYVDTKRYMGR